MPEINVDLKGAKKIRKAMDRASKVMKSQTPLLRATKRAARPVVRAMKDREKPFKVAGNLVRSFAAWTTRRPNRRLKIGARYNPKSAKARAPHAHLAEFGHKIVKVIVDKVVVGTVGGVSRVSRRKRKVSTGRKTKGRFTITKVWARKQDQFVRDALREIGMVARDALNGRKVK
jgi:hypothetical protein